MVASCAPPAGNLACKPGMCPDWESNWQPFGSQAGAESMEPPQPGLIHSLFAHVFICPRVSVVAGLCVTSDFHSLSLQLDLGAFPTSSALLSFHPQESGGVRTRGGGHWAWGPCTVMGGEQGAGGGAWGRGLHWVPCLLD